MNLRDTFFTTTEHTQPSREGRPFVLRSCRSVAINNDRPTIVVSVPVVVTVLPDNDRFATMAVPIPIVFTVTIPIAVTMNLTDGHTATADADPDFFRSGRNCAANSRHGGQCYCVLDHCVLL
jgi:hypothetical protein